jgi:hypothetical protein
VRHNRQRRIVLVVAAIVFGGVAAPAALATYPVLFVDPGQIGGASYITINPAYLESAPEAGQLTITLARPFMITAKPIGAQLGQGYIGAVPIGGGSPVYYDGSFVVGDPSAYAADSNAERCSPGTHFEVWELRATGSGGRAFVLRIAVDRKAAGFTLTMCLDQLHADHVKLSTIYLFSASASGGPIHLPTAPGRYLVDGIITPFASDGSLNASGAYEIRSYIRLPATLTVNQAVYNSATKKFTVSGVLMLRGKPEAGAEIEISGGSTAHTRQMNTLGSARTQATGKFVFTTRTSQGPTYMSAWYQDPNARHCVKPVAAPAGCLSTSFNGVQTLPSPVRRIHR